jgi:hypothetical protein
MVTDALTIRMLEKQDSRFTVSSGAPRGPLGKFARVQLSLQFQARCRGAGAAHRAELCCMFESRERVQEMGIGHG